MYKNRSYIPCVLKKVYIWSNNAKLSYYNDSDQLQQNNIVMQWVYVASLDLCKAFDRVSHFDLLLALLKRVFHCA